MAKLILYVKCRYIVPLDFCFLTRFFFVLKYERVSYNKSTFWLMDQLNFFSTFYHQLLPLTITLNIIEGIPVGSTFNVNSSQIIGNVVNKAGSLFSNIKDVSSKMMNSVAGLVFMLLHTISFSLEISFKLFVSINLKFCPVNKSHSHLCLN